MPDRLLWRQPLNSEAVIVAGGELKKSSKLSSGFLAAWSLQNSSICRDFVLIWFFAAKLPAGRFGAAS